MVQQHGRVSHRARASLVPRWWSLVKGNVSEEAPATCHRSPTLVKAAHQLAAGAVTGATQPGRRATCQGRDDGRNQIVAPHNRSYSSFSTARPTGTPRDYGHT